MSEPFTHICDRCGCPIEEQELRYIAHIQVYAAPSVLKISEEDLRDRTDETQETIEECAQQSEKELIDDVHKEFKFDLCRRCQKDYIRDPIPEIEP